MMTLKNAENAEVFNCIKCAFTCSKKSDYHRHLFTRKHQISDTSLHKKREKRAKKYVCDCGKEYTYRQGLCTHRKKCDYEAKGILTGYENMEGLNFDKEMFYDFLKKNQEFQKDMYMDMQKQMLEFMSVNIGVNNYHTTNSNNKTFNLQLFLNETCKDAINMSEFVNSVKLQLSDLETIGKLGYINGITNIIVKNLKALDVNKRPVHCSDAKREVIYIKEEDKWERENEEKQKIKKVIKQIADKNIRLIPEWREKNPECVHSESSKSDEYNHIIIQSMGGAENGDANENKIIRNIAREILIDKE